MNIELKHNIRHRKRIIVKQEDLNEKVDVLAKRNVYRYQETVHIQQQHQTMQFLYQVNFDIDHVQKQSYR